MSQLKKHSDEIEEIITAPPRWITRWGVTLVIFLLLIVGGFSVVIRYPDTIRVPITIRPDVQFIVSAKTGGILSMIFISDGQTVKAGDTLLVISSDSGNEYVITTRPGIAQFFGFLDEKQPIREGQPLLTIRDTVANAWYGELRGDYATLKNIRVNQSVSLTLPSGALFGQVEAIRISPPDSSVVVKVRISEVPAGFVLSDNVRAEAEIRMNERSVFERLTGSLARRIKIEE